MYTQWLDEDQKDLEITEEDIKQLKKELTDVKEKISAKSNVLSAQEETLNDKDERLHVCGRATWRPHAELTRAGIPVQDPAEAGLPGPDG
jgi:hypothetical protein